MGFAGFNPGLQDSFNSWGLPDRIVREFNLRLIHDVEGMKVSQFERDPRGLLYKMTIRDPDQSSVAYVFTLQMKITQDEMQFFIAEIAGLGFDGNKLFWESPSPGLE